MTTNTVSDSANLFQDAEKILFGPHERGQRVRDGILHRLIDLVEAKAAEGKAAWRVLMQAQQKRLFGPGAFRRLREVTEAQEAERRQQRVEKAARTAKNRRERAARDLAARSARERGH